jgi:hypothetical protein
MSGSDWVTIVASPEQRNTMTSIIIFNWIFLLALFPIAFFWLRRAYRILVKQDFSEVALKKGMPPANAEKYAPYEMVINMVGGAVMVVVLVAVLGFQALSSEDWIAIAGSTLWIKLLASFALSRQAHGLGPKTKAKPTASDRRSD